MSKPRPQTPELIKRLIGKTFRIVEAQIRAMEKQVQAGEEVDIKQLAELTKLLLAADRQNQAADKAAGISSAEIHKKTDEEIAREIEELLAKQDINKDNI